MHRAGWLLRPKRTTSPCIEKIPYARVKACAGRKRCKSLSKKARPGFKNLSSGEPDSTRWEANTRWLVRPRIVGLGFCGPGVTPPERKLYGPCSNGLEVCDVLPGANITLRRTCFSIMRADAPEP